MHRNGADESRQFNPLVCSVRDNEEKRVWKKEENSRASLGKVESLSRDAESANDAEGRRDEAYILRHLTTFSLFYLILYNIGLYTRLTKHDDEYCRAPRSRFSYPSWPSSSW